MDSLTQALLGASVGELCLGKKVGNKAVLWGAIAGTIPDLDVFVARFYDVVRELEIHRGFSHSLIFSLLLAPILAWLIHKFQKKKKAGFWDWSRLFFWCLFTHPLLDSFTTWGTQLFWPLESRIALQSIFVIDPLYTLPLLFAVVLVLFFRKESVVRAKINKYALLISSSYLLFTLVNKQIINSKFQNALAKKQIKYLQFETRPAPFTNLMWTANVKTEENFLLSFYSYFDEPGQIEFYTLPKNHELLYPYRNNPKVEKLIKITTGYYTISRSEEGIFLNDLRFGLTRGWDNANGDFVFQYKISQDPEGIVAIEQVNLDTEEAKKLLESWWKRLKG